MDQTKPPLPRSEMASYLRGLQRGVGADFLGGPVDLAAEVLNAGIHGVNMLGGNLPKIEKPFGGSDWFADRMMSSDDGTPQYFAGRLTPVGVSAAAAVANPLKRLVNALASRPAPGTARAQEGAIRLGGRPDLIASHATTTTGLGQSLGRGQTVELQSPSFAITKEAVPSDFSGMKDSIQLIPRVGAFDPATSSSTLLNRDAYTPRWRQMASKVAGQATATPSEPLFYGKYGGSFKEVMEDLFNLKNTVGKAVDSATKKPIPPEDFNKIFTLSEKYIQDPDYFKALGNAYAGMETPGVLKYKTGPNAAQFQKDLYLFQDVWKDIERWELPGKQPDLREEARKRLVDRLYSQAQGKDVAGMESGWKFNNSERRSSPDFDGDVTGRLSQDLAIKASPAFRSFEQYERHPLGARLLTANAQAPDYDKYALGAMMQAYSRHIRHPDLMNTDLGGLRSAVEEVIRMQGKGMRGDDLMDGIVNNAYIRGYLDPRDVSSIQREPRKLALVAEDLRKAYVNSPAQYAELKAHGPVPVTGENFAGALLRTELNSDEGERAVKALIRAGVPVKDFSTNRGKSFASLYDSGDMTYTGNVVKDWEDMWFRRALELQDAAGPARKQPIRR